MKAIAKLLPVEGEKEDYCQIDGVGLKLELCKENCDKSNCKNIVQIPVEKLFAVTQDIEVGDKIWDAAYSKYGKAGNCEGKTIIVQPEGEAMYESPKESCFKVLGPLSPNAIWVKEGDEIEVIVGYHGWDSLTGKELVICTVKCQCNTYH